jgi:type 1 glutamine amidotransferase
MKAATSTRISLLVASCTLGALACGASGPDLGDLNNAGTGTGGSGMAQAGTSSSTSGTSTGSTSATGGSTTTGGSTPVTTGGSAGGPPAGGAGPMGGSASAGDTGTGGTGGTPPVGPFAPRSGAFKMLVYSKTTAFRHGGSIDTGKVMLAQIGKEQGFDVKATETNEDFTADGLKQYEIVFFLNVTESGETGVFSAAEKQAFDDWMTMGGGAYAGVHAATDGLANKWPFYKDLTGQNYNGHGAQNVQDQVQFEQSALTHPAIAGLPAPWTRSEEWYKFDNHAQWSTQPGVKVLGRKQADGQPIMWVREHATYRMFYTALGHDAAVFDAAKDTNGNMKKHLTGGIMWGVRREHCLATPRPATCPMPK